LDCSPRSGGAPKIIFGAGFGKKDFGDRANANPLCKFALAASRLGIKKDTAKEKRPFSDAEIGIFREALRNEPEWMAVSFEVSLYQALRMRHCQFPLAWVDFERGVIEYPQGFSKTKKRFSQPFDERLRPLLLWLKDKGREITCEIPKMASKAWWVFFRRLKIEGVYFHCLRVNWITRAAKAGVPIAEAMQFVAHSSTEVHRIYLKLSAGDIMSVPAMVRLPEPTGREP
jgi:integrase